MSLLRARMQLRDNPMHKLKILILYPEPAGLALLTSMLKSLGHIIEEATNDRMAVKVMERNNIDLVLAGVDPLEKRGIGSFGAYVRRKHREVPVILLFPRLHPERAKEALRLGAMAVLKYPVPAAELRAAVLQALEMCGARGALAAMAAPTLTSHQPSAAANPVVPANVPTLDLPPDAAPGPDALNVAAPELDPAVISGAAAPATTPSVPQRVELLTREIGLVGMDPSWRMSSIWPTPSRQPGPRS